MLDFPRWRVWMLNIILLAGVLFASPAFCRRTSARRLRNICLCRQSISGSILLAAAISCLKPTRRSLKQTGWKRLEDSIRSAMRRAEPRIAISDVSRAGGQLSFLGHRPEPDRCRTRSFGAGHQQQHRRARLEYRGQRRQPLRADPCRHRHRNRDEPGDGYRQGRDRPPDQRAGYA